MPVASRFSLPLFSVLALGLALPALTALPASAQQANDGTFVLHKFAKAIGKETYTIDARADSYTLTSHFLFTDRGTPVPLETTFTADKVTMAPISYTARGHASRLAAMEDALTVNGNSIAVTRAGKASTDTAVNPWFVADGYSPVAMQEQMMRWWLSHGKPGEFTAFPAMAKVHIVPAEDLSLNSKALHGYTVGGLIWGQECLWLDDDRNLIALVSTDAEFDHFEAIREAYEESLPAFIGAAVKANLLALAKLSQGARMAPVNKLAIVGATIEDSTGIKVPNSVILIQNGLITAAGPRARINIPKDAELLDATGKFAIPGLWDMHAHYEQVEWGPIYLAAGVTSVRDVGNEFDFIRTVHDELDRKDNPAIGPHLEFAGIIDGSGPISLGADIADTPEQAAAWVSKYKAAGARQIKIYSSVKPEIVKAICTDAHAAGMTVTGHIPNGMTAVEGVQDGMDQINHIVYELPYFAHLPLTPSGKEDYSKPPALDLDGPRAKELISVLKAHHTVLDPTVAIFESMMHTKPFGLLEPGIEHLPPQLREALDSPPSASDKVELNTAQWQAIMGSLHALHQAGIPIVAGTDQEIPGYSLHRELELYVEAGFTPLEAIQAATSQAAKALGVQKESGSLEVGKRADVLLLSADPLADIHNTRAVWRTIAAGAIYQPAPLWESVGFLP